MGTPILDRRGGSCTLNFPEMKSIVSNMGLRVAQTDQRGRGETRQDATRTEDSKHSARSLRQPTPVKLRGYALPPIMRLALWLASGPPSIAGWHLPPAETHKAPARSLAAR